MGTMCYSKVKTWLVAVVLIATVGCGSAYDASVEGIVTLDGNPVPAGSIAFVPAQGGPAAYARSDQSGNYVVFTGREAGLPPGKYGVTVVARETPTEKYNKLGGPNPGKQLTPPWYKSSRHTPLNFEVQPGSNDINLELSSEPPPEWNPPQRKRR